MRRIMRTSCWRGVGVWILGLSWLAAGRAGAEEFPSLQRKCINDHAGMVSAGDKDSILSLCEKADREDIKMMIVTVNALDEFHPKPLRVDRFVDDVFEEWDTGYEQGGDAIMMFISKKEREFRVVMGDRYDDRLRKKSSEIIESTLVPAFRKNGVSSGIRQGFRRIFNEVVAPHVFAKRKEKNKDKGR